MKFRCFKTDLTKMLRLNVDEVLLSVSNEIMTITSNNYDIAIVNRISGITLEEGTALVDAKTFANIVRKLPDINVYLEKQNSILLIESGKAKFQIQVFNKEYPQVSYIQETNGVEVEFAKLEKALRQTMFAASTDAIEPIFTGVYMDGENFVALDSVKMAAKKMDLNINQKIIVPVKVLNEVLKFDTDKVEIFCSDKQIMFRTDKTDIIGRLIVGDFIDYRKLLNGTSVNNVSIEVNTEDLINALERALVVEKENKYPVVLNISNETLNLSVKTTVGLFEEEIPIRKSGINLTIGFNARNLIDSLKAVDTEKIEMTFKNDTQACRMNGPDYTFLVMPVRIKKEGE